MPPAGNVEAFRSSPFSHLCAGPVLGRLDAAGAQARPAFAGFFLFFLDCQDNGARLKNQELLRATRPSHAVTYASCQGLTLHNRVCLNLESCHLTLRHLYVGSRATSSELLEAG